MDQIAHGNDYIENRTYDEIQVGDKAVFSRTLRFEDIQLFAIMSGDVNPAHLDAEYASTTQFHDVIAHGMWGGSLFSTLLGTELPGPGTVYLGQTLRFTRPAKVGDTLTVSVTCTRKVDEGKRLFFDCLCTNKDGKKVIFGEAEVLGPAVKVRRPRPALPKLTLA